MNNLHRELAPISDAAWAQIEEEASRTLKRYLAGRRVVDLQGPSGVGLSAVGTGHLQNITAPGEGILARQREVKALVELRVPFDLDRQMIDNVERGANDPDAIAHSLSQLRLVGVNGPYSVLLGADEYTAVAEARDYGYPVLEHLRRIVDGEIIWAPAITGAFVLTTRGGDFDLHIGQDISIGYLSHTDAAVRLYLQESFTFLLLTTEAAVALAPAAATS
jgi:uncharacterized linocin/CFP29 family protein